MSDGSDKKEYQETMEFVYHCIYAEYKSQMRKRSISDTIKQMQKEMYKKHLLRLQEILRENSECEITFKPLD